MGVTNNVTQHVVVDFAIDSYTKEKKTGVNIILSRNCWIAIVAMC